MLELNILGPLLLAHFVTSEEQSRLVSTSVLISVLLGAVL